MKLSQKNCFGGGWFKTGKMNNYNCEIHYDSWSGKYDFVARKTDNKSMVYNSRWDGTHYKTEDECRKACEDWIADHVKEA